MKKAFTLIELLGVLIVLAVIALITFPIIDNSIKNSREQALERTIDSIEEAAYQYSIQNDLGYPTDKQPLYITDMQTQGFLDKEIINPVNNEILSGCVWYYWDTAYSQYSFEYDMECVKVDTEPEINITYNENLINSNGWAKENIAVTLVGNGEVKYCISSSECDPSEVVLNGNNTKFITNEGTNYLCATTTNTLGTSEKKCINIKLDKTAPIINGVGDITVNLNDTVDLSNGVTYSDELSQIDGSLSINPSSIDTSTIGVKEVTYSIKDKAGNTREVVRRITVDADAPSIVFNLVDSSAINSNGWAKNDFYIRATITDNSGSGIKSGSSCTTNSSSECEPVASFTGTTKDFLITTEGSNRACVQVTDNNNKTTKVCSDTYNLDKTAPTAGTATFTGTLGSNNWYTTNVTVNVANGRDSLSGHSSTTSSIASITSNTASQTVTITTTDKAGNSSTRSYTIKVDKNAPTLAAKSGTVEITEGDSNAVTNYFTVSYSTSGGSITCTPTNTSSLAVGTQTLSCTATGGNGLTATATKPITVKAVNLFAEHSWETIANNVKNGTASEYYKVGDTKEVALSGYGTFMVRIANMSTPSECSNSNFSQTACGFVVEFVDSITRHAMNSSNTNVGGYPASEMYTFLQNDIYNALPEDLKSVIINTKVVSNYGHSDSNNFISTDKLYLLSAGEIWGPNISDTSNDNTRQLDYYEDNKVTTSSYSGAIKNYQGNSFGWWTRSAYTDSSYYFYAVDDDGSDLGNGATTTYGVSPAFRINSQYEDTTGANKPELASNMIPIKYNGSNWVYADISEEWYDYNSKEWANAVVLNSGVSKSVGQTISESEIALWYVWIPRYKYQLFNPNNGSVAQRLINVTFESGTATTGTVKCTDAVSGSGSSSQTCTNASKGYWYTHPAFTFGSEQVSGFWVGKFEVSGSTSKITVKPGVSSLRSTTVSAFFTAIQNIRSSYSLSGDSHMMKNMEWGAVAYLKQSKYGLGTTEIATNSNSSYYTGGGNSTTSYKSNTGQSTTGNVYGVYDMSGGAWEYVMGNMVNSSGSFYSSSAGFSSAPNAKYYDKYTYDGSYTSHGRGKLGDATKETLKTYGNAGGGWYIAYAIFVNSSNSWFQRGGHYNSGYNAGVFAFDNINGNTSSNTGARAVLIP